MSGLDIVIIVVIILAVLAFALYRLNKWAYKKIDTQNAAIEQTKMTQKAYIISKKRDKIENVNLPKVVYEKLPFYAKFIKMNFVQCKIGPQIVTLMAQKNVYEALPVKKSVTVDIAGLYIVGMKGMKSEEEMKQIKKEKKQKEKEAKKEAKKQEKKG
ncbi:MAG TPA: hypothetical protein DCG28_05355 [Lachnospiraceae bacterium]|nr:hypothetical protein [Lachnospiraceae bacterium]